MLRRLFLFHLSLLINFVLTTATGQGQEQCAIVVGAGASALEREAGLELQKSFAKLFGFRPPLLTTATKSAQALILVGTPTTNPAVRAAVGNAWPQLSDQGFVLRTTKLGNRPALVVGGGSPVATLWAAYDLLERYGVRHLLSSDYFPRLQQVFRLIEINAHHEPLLPFRCWRVWNAHAFGPESWGLAEQRRVINQLVKMKFNAILVHLWPTQPFVHYEFRGVKKSSAGLFWGWKYPVNADTIGREKFGNVTEFVNPDFAGAQTYEEKLVAGQKLMHGILSYAKSRGMKTVVSFSLIDFPQEFKDQFKNWIPPEMQRHVEESIAFGYEGLYTFGVEPEGEPFLNVNNPVLIDLVETIVKAHIDTYPEADLYEVGTAEFRSAVAGYEIAWKALDRKYGIEAVQPLALTLEKARQRHFHGEGRAEKELKGDIEFLYFLDNLLTERKVLEKTRRPDARLLVGNLTEELAPILPAILPPGTGSLSFIDYVMSLVAKRTEALEALRGLWTMQIMTLQDDNAALLSQMLGRSTEAVTRALIQYGAEGYMVRFWMLGELEPTAYYLGRASWEKDLTVEQAYQDLLGSVAGKAAIAEAIQAFHLIEDATAQREAQNVSGGFPVPGILQGQFETYRKASAERREKLRQWENMLRDDIQRYQAALPRLQKARDLAVGPGRPYVDYFLGRLESTLNFLRLEQKIGGLGKAYYDFHDLKKQKLVAPAMEKRAEVLKLAAEVEELARETVEPIARVARDQADLGMLAIMNRYIYEYAKALHLMIEFELTHGSI